MSNLFWVHGGRWGWEKRVGRGKGGGAKRRKAKGLNGAKKGIKSNPHKPLPNPFIINVI